MSCCNTSSPLAAGCCLTPALLTTPDLIDAITNRCSFNIPMRFETTYATARENKKNPTTMMMLQREQS